MELEPKKEEKPLFTLKKWNAVAVWSWSTNIENCAICKHYLSELCPSCNDNSDENKKCIPIWGNCSHPYHEHCINAWIQKSPTCPLCSAPWVTQKMNVDQEIN